VLIIRWFLDDTRIGQLACDNGISRKTADRYIDEGVTVLKAKAPTLDEALDAAKQAGLTHLNLDGTLIETDRCSIAGPNDHDPWFKSPRAAA
jgi:hypothetical protein